MRTHNIGFYEDLTKIFIELSSNTHLISSAVNVLRPNNFTVNTLKLRLRGSTMEWCLKKMQI